MSRKKPAHFGSLEMRVLGIIETEHPLAVREVMLHLGDQGRDLAYTTVMTICVRLFDKGLLTRKKSGNATSTS